MRHKRTKTLKYQDGPSPTMAKRRSSRRVGGRVRRIYRRARVGARMGMGKIGSRLISGAYGAGYGVVRPRLLTPAASAFPGADGGLVIAGGAILLNSFVLRGGFWDKAAETIVTCEGFLQGAKFGGGSSSAYP